MRTTSTTSTGPSTGPSMGPSTGPSTGPWTGSGRVPVAAWAAALLLTVISLVSLGGAVYFTFVFEGGVSLAAGLPFVAVFTAVSATGVASAAGLLRGVPMAWRGAAAYVVAMSLWTVAKLVFWHETEAVAFGIGALVIGVLLARPATRRHVAEHVAEPAR